MTAREFYIETTGETPKENQGIFFFDEWDLWVLMENFAEAKLQSTKEIKNTWPVDLTDYEALNRLKNFKYD